MTPIIDPPDCPHCESASTSRERLRPDDRRGWYCTCCGRTFVLDEYDGRILAERRRPRVRDVNGEDIDGP